MFRLILIPVPPQLLHLLARFVLFRIIAGLIDLRTFYGVGQKVLVGKVALKVVGVFVVFAVANVLH